MYVLFAIFSLGIECFSLESGTYAAKNKRWRNIGKLQLSWLGAYSMTVF